MITEINSANLYVFLPLTNSEDQLQFDQVEIGGMAMMNEVATDMTDDDVVALTGIANDRCMLLVKFSKEECEERVRKARESLDKYLLEPDDR